MKIRFSYTCLCLLVIALYSVSLNAQHTTNSKDRFSFEFRGEPLSEVLDKIARETGIDMVYDPKIVAGVYIYQRIQNLPVPDLLGDVLEEAPLDFITLSSGTIVIVRMVHERPSYGSYYGKVVDSQTGEPLSGASVMLADASGGTSTSPAGTFAINHLLSGSYQIIFSYVGYKPVYKTVTIQPNQHVKEKVALEPKPVAFTPIIVTGHLPQMPSRGSSNPSIEPVSRWEPAGNIHDAIRSLNLFSGVQYGLTMTDLHVQGGQQGDHRILLDGVPVYNPYSFGRMFSAFSPYAISKVELHKAGYSVPQGSQIAGLINLKHDVSGIDENLGMLQGDPLSLNLRGDLHLPGGGDSPLKIMTAARTNYWNVYQEPTLNKTLQKWDELDPLITGVLIDSENDPSVYEPRKHQANVRFYDVHLASDYAINSYNTLSSSFYAGKNSVSTDLLRQAPPNQQLPKYLYARDDYHWNNFMGQLTYNQLVSPRLDLNTQISFSSNRFRHRYLLGTNNNPKILSEDITADAVYTQFANAGAANRVPAQRSTNQIQHLILRTDGTYSFTPHFNLDAGVQMDYIESRVDLTDLFYLPTVSDQQSTFFSSYLNGNWRMGEYWRFIIGNRLTLTNPGGRFYTEPRAGIQFDHPGSGLGYWSARLSGGLYRQFINQYEITNPGPTSLVPSFTVWSHAGTSEAPKAWHLSGSFRLEPADYTTLNVEWFTKWQPTTYTISYGNLLQGTKINRSGFDAFAETTEMKTSGAGLRLHQSVAESGLQLMLGYDYNFTRINLDTQFGRTLPAPWEEPHRFQVRTLWRVIPDLTAVAKWQSVLGRSWGFRQAYYNFLFYRGGKNFGDFSFTSPEDDRLSPFHQLDFSLIYKPSLSFMDMEMRVDLINLLNRRNTIDWSLQPVQPGNETGEQFKIRKRTMPGFSPSVSVQFIF